MTTDRLDIEFAALTSPLQPVVAVLVADGMKLGPEARALDQKAQGAILKAAEAADFKGSAKTGFEILAPVKLDASRLIVAGIGKPAEASEQDRIIQGGYLLGQLTARKAKSASLVVDLAEEGVKADTLAADLAFGAVLRHYNFKRYLTKKGKPSGNGDEAEKEPAKDGLEKLVVHCADPAKAKAAFARHKAAARGVYLARDLVNEPANVLGPVEFAERVRALEKSGVEVEILDVDDLTRLKMNTLLAVGQGSVRPSRVCVMQWHGAKGKKASKPLAFVGKGVVFDTGGISIKPAAGMEDMKGDMGGAAAVSGLMLALAERKAPVNVVGIIGCVENMPSGSAIRPGDIVTSMSGQTVEILNTDAEGRLVLADLLWYAQERFKPRLVVDLATLTGAIMVALGKEYAGLYSNDDKLADELLGAAKATSEKLWRMPLDKAFDKMIDSKNADMKNIGGRWAGSCTAAQFLQRFIKDTPWAHIDLAGTAMDASRNEISTGWASGYGVRLLDRFIAEHYEKAEK